MFEDNRCIGSLFWLELFHGHTHICIYILILNILEMCSLLYISMSLVYQCTDIKQK